MDYSTVDSSFCDRIGYDRRRRVLEVCMKNGSSYFYAEVPPEIVQDFLAAESKGRFFAQRIKGRYRRPLPEISVAALHQRLNEAFSFSGVDGDSFLI